MGMFIHRRKADKRVVDKKAALPNTAEAKSTEKPSAETIKKSTVETNGSQHTKTEINRASVDELRKMADEIGVVDSSNMTGGELKKLLIERMGL
jgi:DNA uptake protein ComE-like DNA-binding protein